MIQRRLEEICADTAKTEITNLDLSNLNAESLKGLDGTFTSLTNLSLSDNDIRNLKDFPPLSGLTQLNLSNNKITGGLIHIADVCVSLKSLNLNGNDITSIELIEPLKKLACLESLHLMDCPISKIADYKSKVFTALPKLVYLDGMDKDGISLVVDDGHPTETNGKHDATDSVEEDSESEEEEGEGEPGLEQLMNDELDDDEEDEYQPNDVEEDAEDDEEEEEEEDDENENDNDEEDEPDMSKEENLDKRRGVKRKHEEGDVE